MSRLYALLVGIDAYPPAPGLASLRGCRNDVDHARAYLDGPVGVPSEQVRVLQDAAATVGAVRDGFRHHLARATAGDIAVFWFSGHGSRSPVEERYRPLEPSGWTTSLVCVDSRGPGGRDLPDKQVSAWIGELSATGVRVVVVLDCCHSEGTTRSEQAVRWAPPADRPVALPSAPALREPGPGPGSRDSSAPAPFPPHLLLAACGDRELAHETSVAGRWHGLFSATLLDALHRLGGSATGRQLIGAVGRDIRLTRRDQTPVLYPRTSAGPADRPLLGAATPAEPAPYLLLCGPDGWEVDGGGCHGVPAPSTDAATFRIVAGPDRGAAVAVRQVYADRCRVEPVDWVPDRHRQYPVELAGVPTPPVPLVIGGDSADDPAVLQALADAVGRSPATAWLRPVDRCPPGAVGLRLSAPIRGDGAQVRLHWSDGAPAAAPVDARADGVRHMVQRSVHLARWVGLRDRTNPGSALSGLVQIEVIAAYGDEAAPAPGRPPVAPDAYGRIVLSYAATVRGWVAPRVFIRLRNHAPRPLWCVLLDLTDRYASDPALFDGDWVGAGGCGEAAGGAAIEVALPDDRPAVPGTAVTDWLTLIYADEPLNTLPFQLPVPGAAPRPPDGTRDLRRGPRPAHLVDWATARLPLVTVVPVSGGFTGPGG